MARLVVDAVPGSNRDYEDAPAVEESNRYVAEAPPELFRNGSELEDKRPNRVTTDLIDGNLPSEKSAWMKMKERFTGTRTEP